MSRIDNTEDLESLVQTLAAGFGSLLEEAKRLSQRERNLQHKLSALGKEYLRFSDTLPLSPPPDEADSWLENLPSDQHDTIQHGLDAFTRVKRSRPEVAKTNTIPTPASGSTKDEHIEKDFTTPGTPGNLHCPFANPRQHLPNHPDPASNHDPLKTDVQPVSSPPSATGSAGKCPIRFLDQHSPEQVAQYFEQHKHEIPRSHEICVKRYQTNSESIRQLDAKYGSLVSMIQGLGAKHQPYFPAQDEEHIDRVSAERVEQWAEGVSDKSEILEDHHDEGEMEEDDRTGHFERSLRDVRLGESPSRPWGIQIPLDQEASKSAVMSEPVEPVLTESPHKSQALNEEPKTKPTGRCPFSSLNPRASSEKVADTSPKTPPTQSPPPQSIVFTGPVFFGYSAEEAAQFLQGATFGQSKK